MHKHKKLLFIGDSLIDFYDWQKRFPEYAVYNLGRAGETVEGLYSRLDGIFQEAGHPDYIFIMTGINNLAMGDRDSITSYQNVISKIIKESPSSCICIHSLLPVLFSMISNDDIGGLNVELMQLAEKNNITYVDIHTLFIDGEGRPVAAYFLEDGVHVSGEGYHVWSRAIENLLSGRKT